MIIYDIDCNTFFFRTALFDQGPLGHMSSQDPWGERNIDEHMDMPVDNIRHQQQQIMRGQYKSVGQRGSLQKTMCMFIVITYSKSRVYKLIGVL